MIVHRTSATRIALMGGVYGNVPALRACLERARALGCEHNVFLGDGTGCCGHSDEALGLIREQFQTCIAGNHEQEAAVGSQSCGCGYENAEDERYSCMAHQYAMDSLSEELQKWIGTLPEIGVLVTPAGRILLCHGSPARINEFLYESQVDARRLERWLTQYTAKALACTHTGLPWIKPLEDGRLAVNVGAVGKSDHDGDPAVHFAVIDAEPAGVRARIERVEYDAEAWADQLDAEGVDPIFTQPLRTGWWTVGLRSLPEIERCRGPAPLTRDQSE